MRPRRRCKDTQNLHSNEGASERKKKLMPGFWWTNSHGEAQWATIKYERQSDFCYGYGRLGHTTQVFREEVTMFEDKPGHPMYGSWRTGRRKTQRQIEDQVYERLDRVLFNVGWATHFPDAQCLNEIAMGSDHPPIILTTELGMKRTKRGFRFEEIWLEFA